MPAPGVTQIILASHTLFSLAALCVSAMAAEVMMLTFRPPAQTNRCPPGLNGLAVTRRSAGMLTR
jgi:hypothetical protein